MDDHQWYHARRKRGSWPFFKDGKLAIKTFIELRCWFEDHFYSGTTFGTNTKVEHSVTLFLHTTICVLMYLALGHNQVSLTASLLYACNPINNQTSIWLNGRRYSLNIILVLLMMLFPMASPLLYLLTGALQVSAFFSPILLISHSFWYLILIPVFLCLGWKKIKDKCTTRISTMSHVEIMQYDLNHFIVIIKTFGFFFFKMLIPRVCSMQYPDRFEWGLTKKGNEDAYKINNDFYWGVLALFIVIIGIFLLPAIYKPFCAFLLVSTLQWSAVLPITQILSDRYCSLPNVFMMFFVAYLLHFLSLPIYALTVVSLIAYYIICLSVVMPMYKDLTNYYAYHFQYFPNIHWPRNLLITDLMNEGKHDMASQQIFEGLLHNRTNYELLMYGAMMSVKNKDLKNASAFLDEAEKNFYLNNEERQRKEVKTMRDTIKNLIPMIKKEERLTAREKTNFINKRKRI